MQWHNTAFKTKIDIYLDKFNAFTDNALRYYWPVIYDWDLRFGGYTIESHTPIM